MEQTFAYPDYFARFYDVIYHKIRSGVDSAFFLNKIKENTGQTLEIGVGTGRFFAEALQRGADIYGIDISPEMINVLKNKLDPSAQKRIMTGDACQMNLNRKFSLIIAPFRVFSHVTGVNDQLRFLNNVWKHLEPGGQFIFDLFIPDPGLLHNGIDRLTDFEGEYEPGKRLRRITSSVPDVVSQILDITMRFEWEENEQWITKEWQFKLRFFFRYELEHLIKLSKLTLVNIFGDYEQNPLNRNSKEFVLICKR